MSVSFLPKLITDELTDLTPELLQRQGIRLLMMDFDNTIVPYTTDTPTEKMRQWLTMMASSEIPVIVRAKKPGTKGIKECLAKFGVEPGDAALVGDQIFTDTLGANNAGVQPILIRAIDNHNIWLKLRHVAELPFIFAARKRRITK